MTEQSGVDYWGGALEAHGVALPDPRANVGRPVPLDVRMIESLLGHPVGFQKLTVANQVKTLTLPDQAISALIIVTVTPIRFRLDTDQVSVAQGMRADPSDQLILTGRSSLQGFHVIRESGAVTAVLLATYFN